MIIVDEIIKMLDANLSYLGLIIKDDILIISVESKNKEVKCPFCGELSTTRVNSIYHREFQNLLVMENNKLAEGRVNKLKVIK